ncbi:Hypothetical predicted protein [Olea europaea subsp. europaea]|uniref:SHSP domain-containing protein n=1 Tax=Olea europaea subsp. europaea TaxID=158383 RepID=A0A8S0U2N4_OLEEU|nr:Hypothetical predicted protein [Olea europaea subsp. europaea]
MGYIHVCLLNGSEPSLVLIDHNCGYMQLVDTVMAEIGLDPTEVAVTMKYVLKSELPPIVIKNDNNVLSYMALKDMERDPSKYPIIIEVMEEDSQQNNAINVFDPFSLDIWDPFEGFPFSSSVVNIPSSALETSVFANARINWKETPEPHVVKADLPGLKKEEVKVEVEEGGVLQINGERSKEQEEKNDK